jgi:hypothetical protein
MVEIQSNDPSIAAADAASAQLSASGNTSRYQIHNRITGRTANGTWTRLGNSDFMNCVIDGFVSDRLTALNPALLGTQVSLQAYLATAIAYTPKADAKAGSLAAAKAHNDLAATQTKFTLFK